MILSARTGRCIKKFLRHDSMRSVAFMPDGMGLVIGGRRGVVKCFDISCLSHRSQTGGTVDAVESGATKDLTFRKHDVRRFMFSKSLLKLTYA